MAIDFGKLLKEAQTKNPPAQPQSSTAATADGASRTEAATVQHSVVDKQTVVTATKPEVAVDAGGFDLGMEETSNAPAPVTTPAATTSAKAVASLAGITAEKQVQQEQVQDAGAVIEYPGLADLSEKISSLNEALKQNHPAMDSLLQTIHRNLQKDPELVHILKPEQTAILFAGLQKKTNTKIVTETVRSASSGRSKSLKGIGLEDL